MSIHCEITCNHGLPTAYSLSADGCFIAVAYTSHALQVYLMEPVLTLLVTTTSTSVIQHIMWYETTHHLGLGFVVGAEDGSLHQVELYSKCGGIMVGMYFYHTPC